MESYSFEKKNSKSQDFMKYVANYREIWTNCSELSTSLLGYGWNKSFFTSAQNLFPLPPGTNKVENYDCCSNCFRFYSLYKGNLNQKLSVFVVWKCKKTCWNKWKVISDFLAFFWKKNLISKLFGIVRLAFRLRMKQTTLYHPNIKIPFLMLPTLEANKEEN